MTDNEKRAHDLALTIMSIKSNAEIKHAEMSRYAVKLDFLKMYLDAYKEALTKIQSAFPEENQ